MLSNLRNKTEDTSLLLINKARICSDPKKEEKKGLTSTEAIRYYIQMSRQ